MLNKFDEVEASLDHLIETALKVKEQRDVLLSAAKCAENVLWLLEDEVNRLGLRAGNVHQLLKDAIAKAEERV